MYGLLIGARQYTCVWFAMTMKLTKQYWLIFSLKQLARTGHSQLTANSLASKLGVSRGSFYWHFKNVRDFEEALLEKWAELSTEKVIQDLEPLVSPRQRLSALMTRTMRSNLDLERAIRSWAISDRLVAATVKSVDVRRVAYIDDILISMGVEKADAKPRAQMLYWASVGRIMMSSDESDDLSDAQVSRFADLITN